MVRSKNKLAIFNIDGTLTDTVAIYHAAFTEAVRFCGLLGGCFYTHYPPAERYTDLHILNTVFEESGIDPTIDEVEEFERLLLSITAESLNQIHQINGAIDFVNFMHEETDYAIAYATGTFRLSAELKLSIGFPLNEQVSLSACNTGYSLKYIMGEAIQKTKSIYAIDKFERVIVFGAGKWDVEAAEYHSTEFIGIGAKIIRAFSPYPLLRDKFPCFIDYTELMTSLEPFSRSVRTAPILIPVGA
jgi:hypothetical protein